MDFEGQAGGRPRFYGRENLLRTLSTGFLKKRSFGLCGGPGSGKTSVLHQLDTVLRRTWVSQPHRAKFVALVVDLKELRGTGAEQLPAMLWEKIVATVSDPDVRGGAADFDVPKARFIAREGDPWKILTDSCEELWSSLRGTEAWFRYALSIDNADLLLSRQFQNTIGPLLEFIEGGGDSCPHAFLITGGRVLREYLYDDMGYFHKRVRVVLLGPLLEADSHLMISHCVPDISPAQIGEIQRITGNHPYVLRYFLEEVNGHQGGGNLNELLGVATSGLNEFFSRIWEEFDLGRGVTYRGAYAAPEHALMQLLQSCVDVGATVREVEGELGMRPLNDYCEFLEFTGVAERVFRGDQKVFRAGGRLWNKWYQERILS